MAYQAIDMRCPGCGAPVSIGETTCNYCYRPIMISSFNSVYGMSLSDVQQYETSYKNALHQNPGNAALNISIAMCYLRRKLYDKALIAFEKAIEDNFDNSEVYFYAAVALLKGNKPFLHTRDEIQKILDYLNAAISIEDRGIYYYLMAFVKKDYFERKYLISLPKSHDLLKTAKQKGYSRVDVEQLDDILNVATSM